MDILLNSLIISLFCCSWAIIIDYDPNDPKHKQMLLYWLKKPFIDKMKEVEEKYQNWIMDTQRDYADLRVSAVSDTERALLRDSEKRDLKKLHASLDNEMMKYFYLKPIILCVYCFPSFYGSIIYILLNGISFATLPQFFITIISSVILNGIIWNLYQKLLN